MSAAGKPFDVFISHSTQDGHAAAAIKQHLQAAGLKCWKAPDDIHPGESWPSAITRALSLCRVMVLVWSRNSLASREVSKELTLAMRNGLTVIPFRIEDVQLTSEWDYHLVNTHWIDAFPGDLAPFVAELASGIRRIIGSSAAADPHLPDPPSRETICRQSNSRRAIPRFFLITTLAVATLFLLAAAAWFSMRNGKHISLAEAHSAHQVAPIAKEVNPPSEGNYFAKLAAEIAERAPAGESNIGVGNFVFEDTELLSVFSSMLRDELEVALGNTKKFNVILHGRLADLQKEGKFQGKGILEPGSNVEGANIEGVDGIVRGRFYANEDEVTVFAELVWLKNAETEKARLVIPIAEIGTKIRPDRERAAGEQLAGAIKPQNVEQSLSNLQDIAADRLAKIPKDFQVEVFTTDGKRAYAEGETVSFRVRAAEECHIAVLCHQSDGNTVVLFPNRFASNTLIPANKPIDVPGTHKSDFEIEIVSPFGSDVVEVIACSKPSELHKALAEHAAHADAQEPVQVLTRGMAVKDIDSALSSPNTGDGVPLRWGHDSIVVSTFPKP